MRKWNLRPLWIAAALVALALLLVTARWHRSERSNAPEKVSPREMGSKAKAAKPSKSSHAATSELPLPEATETEDPVDDSLEQACNQYYTRELLQYRKRLDPARSADEALDQLLIDRLTEPLEEMFSDKEQALYQAAKRRWPNDIELAWLAYDNCQSHGCDLDAEVRHLLAVDPDNAAAWISAMDVANKRHDPAGFTFALDHAANAEIYDQRSGVVFMHVRKLLSSAPKSSSCQSTQDMLLLKEQIGRAPTEEDRVEIMANAYEPGPALAGLQGCKDPGLATTKSERADCIAVLSRVERGDSLIEQLVATRLLILMQPTSSRAGTLRDRYRQLRWLVLPPALPLPENFYSRVHADGEVATLQALAIERGLWPPPPDWLPDDPQSRALITGEPPP